MPSFLNPFTITKATDFSDNQIHQFWVDLSADAGFNALAKPDSPMPMLIVGGKGCGKTHLMRHFSFPLQCIRYSNDILKGLKEEGYIGIYLRCEGLNAGRFSGKGQTEETWRRIFEYYMELWLAQLALQTVQQALELSNPEFNEEAIAAKIWQLIDLKPQDTQNTLKALTQTFCNWQRDLDYAVNNSAITHSIAVDIKVTRSRLIFGIPAILSEHSEPFKDIQFLYLIDELENLVESQQEYLNTLIRERGKYCSFKIGARLYGVKTLSTYSAGEENREGSEFERLPLDSLLRDNRQYSHFIKSLLNRRIIEAGYPNLSFSKNEKLDRLSDLLFTYPKSKFAERETAIVLEKFKNSLERPYFEKLRSQLASATSAGLIKKLTTAEIEECLELLTCSQYPTVEKLNIFFIYKAWSRSRNLLEESQWLNSQCTAFVQGHDCDSRYSEAYGHFKYDFIAQINRDFNQKQKYLGLDTFITMSSGLPRNLLNILKHVFRWSLFNGEKPFQNPISIDSQTKGVKEASSWFFDDAVTKGPDAPAVCEYITRVGRLFREARFADKPSECSPCSFSVDFSSISSAAKKNISLAEKFSLLIRNTKGHRDRNVLRVDEHFQLNPMLSPLWDLPIARRGTISLNSDEIEAIFAEEKQESFEAALKIRRNRMNAPFKERVLSPSDEYPTLF